MNKVREFLKGKKTYIGAAIGLLGAVMAWADGQINGAGLRVGGGGDDRRTATQGARAPWSNWMTTRRS